MEKPNILVVDDDREIVRAIATLLEREDMNVYRAYNGLEALEMLTTHSIQMVLLDVMMPKLDGLSATMKIRASKNIPIIILSAKSEDTDKILGLSIGADDYVTKPFNSSELVARVKSQLRRYINLGDIQKVQQEENITIGGLTLDRAAKQVLVDGEPAKMTATEYKIVELLMKNVGQVFSSEEIYRLVWNEDAFSVENTVMVHIRHIRSKIEIDPKNPRYLKVVWGIGYKIDP